MRTLLLLRHGKAVASDPAGDHDRALNERGRAQSKAAGELLGRLGLEPELALVSDAKRTQETATLVLAAAHPEVRIEAGLYAASVETLLGAVRAVPDETRRVLVVGHNPDIGELARLLAGSGEPQAVIGLHQSFPTAALAVLEFDAGRWSDVAAGSGTLTRFIVPDPPAGG